MPSEQTYRKLRIFIACPGDLKAEKDLLLKIVDRLQKPARESGYFLEAIEWRQVIGMGRPQQVIFDESQPERWDIFVGIIWMRFGSPPGGQHPTTGLPLESGTQEEFLKAYELWKEHSWPRILFYRCTRSPERLDQVDAEQLTKINNFFAQFDASGDHPGIYKSYSTVEEFDHSVYDDLRDLIGSASITLNLKREVEKAVAEAGDSPAKGLVTEFFDTIERLYTGRGSVTGLSTGFVELDRLTNGLHPGEMIVIAGHPGIGKTALVIT